MTDMRQCDICREIRPLGAPWWFITLGKANPSEWQLPKHWCASCMTTAADYLTSLAS